MIIFKDVFSGDELFSDTYPIKEIEDGLIVRVQGKHVTEDRGMGCQLSGANASAEEASEDMDEAKVSGVNVVLAHNLVEFPINKKQYKGHIKDFMRRLALTVEESKQEKFKKDMGKYVMESIIKQYDDLQFYCGESMKEEGMLAICKWEGDAGDIPCFYFFNQGLNREKV